MTDIELQNEVGTDIIQIMNDVGADLTLRIISFSGGSIYGEPLMSGNSFAISGIIQPMRQKFILDSAGKWKTGDCNGWFLSGGSITPLLNTPFGDSGGSLFFIQHLNQWYEIKEAVAPDIAGSYYFIETKLKLGSPLA